MKLANTLGLAIAATVHQSLKSAPHTLPTPYTGPLTAYQPQTSIWDFPIVVDHNLDAFSESFVKQKRWEAFLAITSKHGNGQALIGRVSRVNVGTIGHESS